MGYYDNVKDSIREENDESSEEESSDSSSGISGNFDTLREAAEETEVEDDEGGDGTPIEVLEEDGLKKEAPSQSKNKQRGQKQPGSQRQQQQSRKQTQANNTGSEASSTQNSSGQALSGDTSDLEDKLDKIIEQNSRMIEILESFGN
ncbi:MAG: hypothetical protein ABEK04_01505 [Candidatus Nanohalobium sp.]